MGPVPFEIAAAGGQAERVWGQLVTPAFCGTSAAANLLVTAFCLLGIWATAFHAANGAWTGGFIWNLAPKPESKRRWGRVCVLIGVMGVRRRHGRVVCLHAERCGPRALSRTIVRWWRGTDFSFHLVQSLGSRIASSSCRPGRKRVVSLELDYRPDAAEVGNVRIARGSGATNRNNPSLAEQPREAALNANRNRGRNRTQCSALITVKVF